MPSSTITTSVPCSTRRLARSIASSATCVCSSAGRSNVLAITSPRSTWRRMSVTSSGRSSTSSTMRCTSGLLRSIAYTSCFSTVVLPALGGDTINPRCPLPIGDDQVDDATGDLVRFVLDLELQLRVGEQRGEVFEARAARAASDVRPLISSTRSSAGYFSLLACGREKPLTESPLRSAKRRTCDADT